MVVFQEVRDRLNERGIIIQNHPYDSEQEWLDKCWEEAYRDSYDYNKDMQILTCGEFRKMTHEELHAHAKYHADQWSKRKAHNWYDSQCLYIFYEGRKIRKKVNVKSFIVTEEFVDKIVEKDRKAYDGAYGKFAIAMQQLLKANQVNCWSIYPTTYGIGVWNLYNASIIADTDLVDSILKERGIEYRNEFSDAEWVFRYVISKKEANKLKLEAL